MNTEQFAKYIAEHFEFAAEEAKTMIEVFSCSVYMALSEGHKVDIESLGSFDTVFKTVRKKKSYLNGMWEQVTEDTEATKKLQPVFKPGNDLKMACAF